LEIRSTWEKFWLEQVQELEPFAEVDDEEGIRSASIKSDLKKELNLFGTILECLRFFLASGTG
jgi:hypothetical protein